jgi:[ribosomal protein S18]-alanine N-acetyltransferase
MMIKLTSDEHILDECALLMSQSEPWLTLKRGYSDCQVAMRGQTKEVYVVFEEEEIIGFAVLQMEGSFKGYIQTLFVKPGLQGKGIGSKLIEFCCDRIFKISPNVFMCVSSFNTGAQKLYEKHGFTVIGTLKDFVLEGYDELLLRKTIGSMVNWKKNKSN